MRVIGYQLALLFVLCCTIHQCIASHGDRLPEFQNCVEVCKTENCVKGKGHIPLNLRLFLWTCPQECDYTCQHVITDQREARDPPMMEPVVQFHGKWPFHRFMGIQEPFSVLFSLFNFLAYRYGMEKLRKEIPARYPVMPYYLGFGYFGLASWTFSMIFHSRDFDITEKLDYFGAGASVMYDLFYTPVRVFRLDQNDPTKQSFLRFWTALCICLYIAHVSYLSFWRWDYTYNMAANVAAGIVQNLLWSWFSIQQYRRLQKTWAAWPGLIVAWIILAMSLELFDFPPWGRLIDAHSLWHLGTVGPTIWWYRFLARDAKEDLSSQRLKA